MNEKCEIVYVLRNESMPGLIKIGKTQRKDINSRMQELYSTGVPLPFDCLWAGEVDNCSDIEFILHNAFQDFRINPKREFFKLEPDRVIPILKKLSIKEITSQIDDVINNNVTKEEKDAISAYRKRRPNLNFDEMGIDINSELVYSKDENIRVKVVSSQKVLYYERECSLSGLTKELLHVPYYVAPCKYWLYNGKNLDEIYEETYPYTEE